VAKEKVFGYLSDIHNLPRWATEFCQELKLVSGKYKVVTCPAVGGHEVFFRIQTHRPTGVIDMLAGPTEDNLALFPVRVVKLADESSAVLFTLFQDPGTSDEQFDRQVESLRKEFEILENRLLSA
jgi:hypothetical protein